MGQLRILCVCRGNHDRSPLIMGLIADVFVRRGVDATVDSCGIMEEILSEDYFLTASKNSITVLQMQHSINISSHKPRHISEFDLGTYDRIIVVTEEVKMAVIERGASEDRVVIINEANGGLDDPYGKKLFAYMECLAIVERELPTILEGLI